MKSIAIIGGGVAGMEAAAKLSRMGFSVTIIEEKEQLGGKLTQWHALFPARRPAAEVLANLKNHVKLGINTILNARVEAIEKDDDGFAIALNHNRMITAHAILLATGFDVFDASKKEEYGYGIYDNVITSVDLEKAFNEGKVLTAQGKTPKKIGFIHCVGSRDEKAGNPHCSKVCCITGVKQAIELKEMIPDSDITMFYMDLRMFGRHFEELYKEAQVKHHIQFIRGRLSEAFENQDYTVMIKVEDTLLAKPLKMNLDLLVLLVGIQPARGINKILYDLEVEKDADGFLKQTDNQLSPSKTNTPGVFAIGTTTGPKTIEETISEARAVTLEISDYLHNKVASRVLMNESYFI
ncbi:MAG: CoB--CoM heterodisulfide reductase iron-sulfur subunit A family protein [Bacteroidales bacterium]|nr:CoB--CoM heterodisulfide reductase iron-sulfur subunit A family protein [Bacteroidales bacterium]